MGDHTGGGGRKGGYAQGRILRADEVTVGEGYKTFANNEEAYTYMNTFYGRRVYDLTKEEQDSFKYWSGSSYARINGYLRGDVTPLGNSDQAILENIDFTMARPNMVTDYAFTAKRAFGSYTEEVKKMPVGTILTDNGFSPTSVNTGRVGWSDSTYPAAKVLIPVGVRGAWIRNQSNFPNEGEFLLARGTSFRIVKNDSDGLVLEVAGQISHSPTITAPRRPFA